MSENIWGSVLSAIEKRVNHESFTTWFRPTSMLSLDGSTLKIKIPDRVFEDWILNNYRDVLEESMDEVGITGCSILFETSPEFAAPIGENRPALKSESANPAPAISATFQPRQYFSTASANSPRFSDGDLAETHLNQKYTFDNFVVGSSNQFAHAAALAVADTPSKTYNPLFLYGGVGLGKTHLMCAIGHRIKEQYRHLRLCYISAERFMNELINAIRYDQTNAFRERYRSIDILLVDDIQFIAGKERTQEEFFHTFNALHDGQKQIVISADCAPKEIPTLEERLHSRFEWGLIADISPPDIETKVAILRKKAELENLNLPDDVAMFIAQKIKSNIRELEGSLVRLTALSSLRGDTINLALAQEAIKNIIEEEQSSITIEGIQKIVAHHYKLKVSELKSKSNAREIAFPRQVAMYLCKQLTRSSLPEIGREFGDKHHTTVMHSVKKIQALYAEKKGNFHTVINSLIASCK
ncbi:MAG: chromosomal replication initiator protein DnaA [Blastocatellia bacterium]